MILLVAIVFIMMRAVASTTEKHKNTDCDSHCDCSSDHNAVCTGYTLTYIPKFPKSVWEVQIISAHLLNLGEDGFTNVTDGIIKINLTNNFITFIHPKALTNMTILKSLIISNETNLDINVLKTAFSNMKSSNLKTLYLTQNNWTRLPTDMFTFANSKLSNLILDGNKFQYIDFKAFKHLSGLMTLSISDNLIEKISVAHMANITKLCLNKNKFSKPPNWCSGQSLMPKLRNLNMAENNLGDTGKTSFPENCLPNVEELNLRANHIGRIQDNTFAKLPKLKFLDLSSNALKEIQPFGFNSSSLETLRMIQTKFRFDMSKGYNSKTIFAYCPHLQKLDLTENNFRILNSTLLQEIFSPLEKLRKLILEGTGLAFLPYGVFTMCKELETIQLSNNRIAYWNESEQIFGNSTNLTTLDLSHNLISVINRTSFPDALLSSLKKLNLDKNPFSCTCDQLWFLNWTKHNKAKLKTFHQYKCSSPITMYGVSLKDYHPTQEGCTLKNPLIMVAIVISSFGSLIMLIIFVSFKCQTNIKNYIYLVRLSIRQRQGYIRLDSAEDFEYHAFVVYCDADRNWVHKKFLPKIEEEEGMKLCIRHRDLDVGCPIVENIDKYLTQSRKVVVVMSNEFAKSEWCQWEVDVVQERRRRQGNDVFLLIVLKSINSNHMTSHMRTLIHSSPHLQYCQGIGENLFWTAVVEGLRKPIGQAPISLL